MLRRTVEAIYATRVATDPNHGRVLTDDFNPVEFYDAANREQLAARSRHHDAAQVTATGVSTANNTLTHHDGKVDCWPLLAQEFQRVRYFWPQPYRQFADTLP